MLDRDVADFKWCGRVSAGVRDVRHLGEAACACGGDTSEDRVVVSVGPLLAAADTAPGGHTGGAVAPVTARITELALTAIVNTATTAPADANGGVIGGREAVPAGAIAQALVVGTAPAGASVGGGFVRSGAAVEMSGDVPNGATVGLPHQVAVTADATTPRDVSSVKVVPPEVQADSAPALIALSILTMVVSCKSSASVPRREACPDAMARAT